jgi:ABC-type lipopolysaccharide export system ATPase subunit
MMEMTNEERLSIANMKRWRPFRVVWGMINKDTGKFTLHANTTERPMYKAAKAGHLVVQAK